jgi:hypothetical protein
MGALVFVTNRARCEKIDKTRVSYFYAPYRIIIHRFRYL